MPIFSNGFHPASSPRVTGSEPLLAELAQETNRAVDVLDGYWDYFLLVFDPIVGVDNQSDYEGLRAIAEKDETDYSCLERVVIVYKNVVFAFKVNMDYLFSEGSPNRSGPETFKNFLFGD